MKVGKVLGNVAICVFTVSACLALSEGALRVVLHANEDGNLLVSGKPLKPLQFPKATVRKWYEAYKDEVQKEPSSAAVKYDPALGWTNNPTPMLEQLEKEWPIVRTEGEIQKHSLEKLFVANDGHHAPLGSKIVAEVISNYLKGEQSLPSVASR